MKMKESMKKLEGYSVKYALTAGIAPVVVEQEGDEKYVYVCGKGPAQQLIIGRTFFESREAAEEKAREMACRKVASLEKQLAEMRALAETPKYSKGDL